MMHTIKVDLHQMTSIWRALNAKPEGAKVAALERRCRAIVRAGYAAGHEIEDVVYDCGCGLETGNSTLRLLSYSGHVLYPRPGLQVTAVHGYKYNTAAEVAALLKMMERLGLAVDPAPLVDMLLPSLKPKKSFTQAEMDVWWFHKERHRMETVMVETERGTGSGKYHKFKTLTGYKVEASERGDRIEWLTVKAPKYRFRSKLMAA